MIACIGVRLTGAEGHRIMDEASRASSVTGSPADRLASFLDRVPAGTVAVVLADNTEWTAMDMPWGRRWVWADGEGMSSASSADLVTHADRLMVKAQRRAARRAARALRAMRRAER